VRNILDKKEKPVKYVFRYQFTCLILLLGALLPNTSFGKQPDFHIDFIMDKTYDEYMIYVMLRPGDPAGLISRAKSMGIDLELARTIKEAKSFAKIKRKLDKLVNAKYHKESDNIKKSIKEYALSWETIKGTFSNIIVDITEHDWFYDKYTCVVSPFHRGISNWYGNKIVRKYNEDPIRQRRITAHEIVLSHIFHIVRKYYKKEDLDDWKVWKFAEISTVFVLNDERLRRFWPWFIPPEDYFSKSNYPQLAPVESKLKTIYNNRKDFKDYLDKSIKIQKTIDCENQKHRTTFLKACQPRFFGNQSQSKDKFRHSASIIVFACRLLRGSHIPRCESFFYTF
jgi:hypothetical protein